MDNTLALTSAWLQRACRDLAAARKLGSGADPFPDIAVCHCQQAAEKASKGFLLWREIPFSKTHDLRFLVQTAANEDPDFKECESTAELLTPYATQFRYPGESPVPSEEELQTALSAAEEILGFVLTRLPGEVGRCLSVPADPSERA